MASCGQTRILARESKHAEGVALTSGGHARLLWDWMLFGPMFVEFEGDVRLPLTAAEHLFF